MPRVVEKPTKENEDLRTTLDEILQRGALKMLHEALEAEVEEYLARHREVWVGHDDPARRLIAHFNLNDRPRDFRSVVRITTRGTSRVDFAPGSVVTP
jgi:hypothetical protein